MMPAEYAGHQETLMCWPARDDIWDGNLVEAEAAFAELANTIAQYEPVTMFADPKNIERAMSQCGSGVTVSSLPLNDSWCRDSGPIYVHKPNGNIVGLDFIFNGWGEKFVPYGADAEVARRATEFLGDDVSDIQMVLEGGSINVDGAGTLITTMQCLLHPNRNPSMSQREIENVLSDELGVSSVIWLPHGLALDFDTDGHVDNVAAFTRPGHALLQGCNDPNEEDYVRLTINEKIARSSVTASGKVLQVDVVPVLPFVQNNDERIVVPYLNFYIGNNFVIIPVCGHEADTDMVQMISEYFPGRTAVALDIGRILAIGGGGIHCITQQRPASLSFEM